MITGSADERKMLADISRATHSLERIAIALEAMVPVAVTTPHDAAPTPGINPERRTEMLAGIQRDMSGEMRGLLGSGYVPGYYASNASAFVLIAERLADEVARGDWA